MRNWPPLKERFFSKLIPIADGCWGWSGSTDNHGYGQISVGSKQTGRMNHKTHRLGYELMVGPIPPGMKVLHRCDNPICARPDHLFLGNQADNMADMIAKGRDRKNSPKGVRSPHAKLTDALVAEIRSSPERSQSALSRRYGVARSTIQLILARKAWSHVP